MNGKFCCYDDTLRENPINVVITKEMFREDKYKSLLIAYASSFNEDCFSDLKSLEKLLYKIRVFQLSQKIL